MKELWGIYHHEIPMFIKEFSNTSPMQRIKDIGMNCGLEYTSFEMFQDIPEYSRYDHSIGVALIIYHFTGDIKQSVAGLFHDIASPVFAHTIDFLNHDYLKQESTEALTKTIIEESQEIQELLNKYHLTVDDICDYHRYPVADNDSPQLSSDRLEYTLCNIVNYHYGNIQDIKEIYEDISIGNDEDGNQELIFNNLDIAVKFSKLMIETSKIYIADADRYSMEYLARILKLAISEKIICYDDLYLTEPYIIEQLNINHQTRDLWRDYRNNHEIFTSINQEDNNWLKVDAKKRYINVLVKDQRVCKLSDEINNLIEGFKSLDFNYYVLAK